MDVAEEGPGSVELVVAATQNTWWNNVFSLSRGVGGPNGPNEASPFFAT